MTTHEHSPSREGVFSWRGGVLAAATFLVLSLTLASCDRSDTDGGEYPEQLFTVRPDDLGPEYQSEALGIGFNPPLGWEEADDSTRDLLVGEPAESAGQLEHTAELEDLFIDMTTFNMVLVWSVVSEDGSPLSVPEYDEILSALYSPTGDPTVPATGERTTFQLNGIDVIHYRHVVTDRAGATLLFEGADRQTIRLDYLFTFDSMDEQLPMIESSIGTLRRIE